MKLGTIADPSFVTAFSRLAGLPLPPKAAYWVSKVVERVDKENRRYHKLRHDLLKKHALLDAKGEIKVEGEKKEVVFKDDGAKEAFIKEQEELGNIEIVLPKIQLSLLGEKVEIDGGTLAVLSEIVVDEPA